MEDGFAGDGADSRFDIRLPSLAGVRLPAGCGDRAAAAWPGRHRLLVSPLQFHHDEREALMFYRFPAIALRTALALVVLMLVAAGCGSDDADDASEDATTTTSAPATTSTTAAVTDDPDTLNAITAISEDVSLTFNDDVECVLGADDGGSIEGTAEDGSTIAITLDGTASRVVIDGPQLSMDVEPTTVTSDQTGLTIEASPPATTILVALAFCDRG